MNSNFLDFQMFAYPEGQNPADNWQGAGKAGVLVLHHAAKELPEEDQVFLNNVLKAVKLSPLAEQVFLGPCTQQAPLSVVKVASKYNVETVLLFGVEPVWAGVRAQLPYYQFVRIGDLHFLRAHSLKQIREERQANKNQNAGALWNALKAKFI